jgi:hypothetical protein
MTGRQNLPSSECYLVRRALDEQHPAALVGWQLGRVSQAQALGHGGRRLAVQQVAGELGKHPRSAEEADQGPSPADLDQVDAHDPSDVVCSSASTTVATESETSYTERKSSTNKSAFTSPGSFGALSSRTAARRRDRRRYAQVRAVLHIHV